MFRAEEVRFHSALYLLVLEQIIQKDFAVDNAAVFVPLHAVGRDHGELDRLSAVRFFPEGHDLVPQSLVVVFVDLKLTQGKLDLTDVDHLIPTIDQQIDLRTVAGRFFSLSGTVPGGFLRQHAGDSQLFLDLRNMILAQLFERKPGPGAAGGIVQRVAPEMLVPSLSAFDESVVEQGVVIRQLV